jgi:hypothetical protein
MAMATRSWRRGWQRARRNSAMGWLGCRRLLVGGCFVAGLTMNQAFPAWAAPDDSPTAEPVLRVLRGPERASELPASLAHDAVVRAWLVQLPSSPPRAEQPAGIPGAGSAGFRWSSHVGASGSRVWQGTRSADAHIQLTVTPRGLVAGHAMQVGRSFDILPAQPGQAWLAEIDVNRLPGCGADRTDVPRLAEDQDSGAQAGSQDALAWVQPSANAPSVDVLTVYSGAARAAAGGNAQIEAEIQAAINGANVAFANSKVYGQLRLVKMAEIDISETGVAEDDLNAVRDAGVVEGIRNQVGADVVSIVLESLDVCGTSYTMRVVGPEFAAYAYQVTARRCALSNFSLAHEHGHHLGLEHNPESSQHQATASFDWAFGHYRSSLFRTVMSYSSPCPVECPRIPYFSNPLVSFQGEATGMSAQRDNALVLNTTLPIVAAFKTSSACIDNDGDGYPAVDHPLCSLHQVDCNDADAAIHPSADERPAGSSACKDDTDNDCDGKVDAADADCSCSADADCDDANPCTTEYCNGKTCVSSALSGNSCNDRSACTLADRCVAGECTGEAIDCGDGDACTSDRCELAPEGTPLCKHDPDPTCGGDPRVGLSADALACDTSRPDADGDGLQAQACGGLDCDDTDVDVRAAADGQSCQDLLERRAGYFGCALEPHAATLQAKRHVGWPERVLLLVVAWMALLRAHNPQQNRTG